MTLRTRLPLATLKRFGSLGTRLLKQSTAYFSYSLLPATGESQTSAVANSLHCYKYVYSPQLTPSSVLWFTALQTCVYTKSTYTYSRIQIPPISTALGVLHHQHAERKGLVTLARFSCALEEFAKSQWGAKCHVTDRAHTYGMFNQKVLSVYSVLVYDCFVEGSY